jgi:hypothetical protein
MLWGLRGSTAYSRWIDSLTFAEKPANLVLLISKTYP